MKQITLIFTLLLGLLIELNAQAPQQFHYQAVARTPDHQPYENANLRIRFFLLEDSVAGTVRYVEEHIVTTTALGLFQTNIGGGTAIMGSMDDVHWALHPYFLRVEMNPQLIGGAFIAMGTNQLLSVPYALYAATSGSNNTPQLALTGNQLSISGGNSVLLSDNSATNELQTLSLSGNVLSLSNGGGAVTLPNGGGGSYSAGSGIIISGQTISAIDPSSSNELQSLSLTGNVLSLSNGGGAVTLPGGGTNFSLPYQGDASYPDAVFDVKNTGPGPAVRSTTSNAQYPGLTAYNEANGNTAHLAGPNYGAHLSGPVRITDNFIPENGTAMLDLHNLNGNLVESTYRPLNNEWKHLHGTDHYQLRYNNKLITYLSEYTFDMAVPKMVMGSLTNTEIALLSAMNGKSILELSPDLVNFAELGARPGHSYWGINEVPKMTIPFGIDVLEPWAQYGLDFGSVFYPWNYAYATALIQTSDERLKEQIHPTRYGLQTVLQLRPVDYFWKNKNISEKPQTGFLAQEVEKIMPNAVVHTTLTDAEIARLKSEGKPLPENSDAYGVNYQAILPVLVKAVQEQQEMIEQLRRQNELLLQRIESLEK